MDKTNLETKDVQAASLANRWQIQEKLEQVLAELKPSLGEKKFKKRMKKAGKLIGNGLKKKLKPQSVKA